MSMKESDLLQDLIDTFAAVGTPAIIEAADSTGVTVCGVEVFESGVSEADKKPTGNRRIIRYYVLDRGKANESAFYMQQEPKNQVDADISAKDNSLLSFQKVYASSTLRQRVQAAMTLAAFDIINEDPATANHAARLQWAAGVFNSEPGLLNAMMSFVSINVSIRAAGGSAIDSDIQWVVNGSIELAITLRA